MASVDDRIVAMKFDNAAFEQKIATTMASLDKLKGSLDFANSTRGLNDLTTAGHNFSLEGIASAVSGIESKFSVMGAVALSVINSIVSRAFTAGESIVKSLSLDQIIGGYQEYETNLNSIQTVLANTKSKGTDLDDVNRALDQLNTYSDQTIYNFSQMAKNIGTFTAAGIDLDSSVAGIKGIANLAAISGSNADQASTAMYQLSQALASGSVKLMDWNSVVNAGMGGEVFQKALFETGKNLKTIKDVPMGQTFDEWKAAGNTFRSSLESGWITAQVLTDTLSGFTGDLTEAQIKAMGYTDEQTKGILEMGKTGKEAATKVKTLTQLISTVKEAIGSGWSASFRIIFGDFEEARTLFTSVSDALNGIIGASADSRNALLQNWKDLGGRQALIDGITNAFRALSGILAPIKAAFHDVFPPFTVVTLLNLTNGFKDLMANLKPSPAVAVLITRTFRGIFAAFSIGIDIVKGIAGFFRELFNLFADENPNTGILGFAANLGDKIVALKALLDRSNGIADFFHHLAQVIYDLVQNALPYIDILKTKISEVRDWVVGLFKGSDAQGPDLVSASLGILGERFGWLIGLGHILAGAWDKLSKKFPEIQIAFGKFGDFIQTTFSGLPQKIANALANTDYNQALDTVNTGLFGALTVMIGKFLSGGFNFGGSGILKNISKSFETLTGTLKAMQTNLKADTLLKIAEAVGLLAVSIVILSLIDSGALTKSMAAMAVGFTQLVTVMALLDKLTSGPMSAAKLAIVAGGMILLAAAMVVMSVAVKILSTMDVSELEKGIGAITIMLGVLAVSTKFLSDNAGGMIRSGIGLIAVAIALNILALAVKSFAEMSWTDMAKGMSGVAVGLGILAGALNLMPSGMVLTGVGLLAISVALNIMALAVKSFAEMKWAEMGKGLAGIAGILLILAGAMNLMPNGASLALQGVGLALIGVGLIAIAKAIGILGKMSWGSLTKGLVGIAGALVLLSAAALVMQGSIGGALAIAIMALSMGKLAKGLKEFVSISWGDLLHGLVALAAVLAVLGLGALAMQPAIPALLGLGVALLFVGAGFALFGLGASLVATAFAVIATAGTQGVATLAGALDVLISHLPAIIAALADGLIELAQRIVVALPGIIGNLSLVIQALLQLIIDNIPKLAEVFTTFILSMLDVIGKVTPDIIAAGWRLLLDFLQGIDDNIEEVTTRVISIIVKFLNEVAAHAGELVTAGLGVLTSFLQGIADNISAVVTAGISIVVKLIEAIGYGVVDIIAAGADMIVNIIKGIGDSLGLIITAGVDTLLAFIQGISDNVQKVVTKGFEIVIEFINGIAESIRVHAPELRAAGWNLASAILEGFSGGITGGSGGIKDKIIGIVTSPIGIAKGILGANSPSTVMMAIGADVAKGFALGMDNDTSVHSSAINFGTRLQTSLQNSLSQIPTVLDGLDEFNPTITPVLDLTNIVKDASQLNNILNSGSFMAAQLSYNQAVDLAIATRSPDIQALEATPNQPREIKFEQNNYSPEALSAAEIYRQTHNQIAMAKEELAVL